MRYTAKRKFIIYKDEKGVVDPDWTTGEAKISIAKELFEKLPFRVYSGTNDNGDMEYSVILDCIVENYDPYIARTIEKAKVELQNRNVI